MADFIESCCKNPLQMTHLKELGFQYAILEEEKPSISKKQEDLFFLAKRMTIFAEQRGSFDLTKTSLQQNRAKFDLLALNTENEALLRFLIEEKLFYFDILTLNLDSTWILKTSIIKAFLAQDIFLELDVTKLLDEEKRSKYLAAARHVVNFFVRRRKGVPNLLLTSRPNKDQLVIKTPQELIDIGQILGLRESDARSIISTSVQRCVEVARERRDRLEKSNLISVSQVEGERKRKNPNKIPDEKLRHVKRWNVF